MSRPKTEKVIFSKTLFYEYCPYKRTGTLLAISTSVLLEKEKFTRLKSIYIYKETPKRKPGENDVLKKHTHTQ